MTKLLLFGYIMYTCLSLETRCATILVSWKAKFKRGILTNEVVEIDLNGSAEQIRVDNTNNSITMYGVEKLSQAFGLSIANNEDGTITLIHDLNGKGYYVDATVDKNHADAESVHGMVCFVINKDSKYQVEIKSGSKELAIHDYNSLFANENETITITLNRKLNSGEVVRPLYEYNDKGGAASINNIKVTSGNTIELPVSALISVAKQASKNAGARPLDGIYRVRVERTLNGATKSIGYCEFTMATGLANR